MTAAAELKRDRPGLRQRPCKYVRPKVGVGSDDRPPVSTHVRENESVGERLLQHLPEFEESCAIAPRPIPPHRLAAREAGKYILFDIASTVKANSAPGSLQIGIEQ